MEIETLLPHAAARENKYDKKQDRQNDRKQQGQEHQQAASSPQRIFPVVPAKDCRNQRAAVEHEEPVEAHGNPIWKSISRSADI